MAAGRLTPGQRPGLDLKQEPLTGRSPQPSYFGPALLNHLLHRRVICHIALVHRRRSSN